MAIPLGAIDKQIMKHVTVRKGLYWLSASILAVSLLSFFFGVLSSFLNLSSRSSTLLLFWGLFIAGTAGCCGIIIVINGILDSSAPRQQPSLLMALVVFILSVVLFCLVLDHSFNEATPPQLRPGETITL